MDTKLGTVTITVEEFERMRQIERDYNLLINDDKFEFVVLETNWSHTRLLRTNDMMKQAIERRDAAEKLWYELKDKRVPMFNRPGKKVWQLK